MVSSFLFNLSKIICLNMWSLTWGGLYFLSVMQYFYQEKAMDTAILLGNEQWSLATNIFKLGET